MGKLGAKLKNEREQKGIRLEEIASITKISLTHLKFLEQDQWGKLPPEPFIRGFISAYATYVGLDPHECILLYRQEIGADAPKKVEVKPPTQNKRETETPHMPPKPAPVPLKAAFPPWGKLAAGMISLVVVLIVGGIIYIGKGKQEAQQISQAQINLEPAADALPNESEQPPAELEGREVSSQVPPTLAHELFIQSKERTWVKIVIDDEPPREFFLREGGKVKYNAKEKIKLILGNSTGASVKYNGKDVSGDPITPGTLRYVFPQNAEFPQEQQQKSSDG